MSNLQSFCRVCLCELSANTSSSIERSHYEINKNELQKTLQSISGVIMETDEQILFPQSICHSCYIKMNAFLKFRDNVIITTGVFKMLFAESLNKGVVQKLKSICRICRKQLNIESKKSYKIEKKEEVYFYIYECTGLVVAENELTNDPLGEDQRFPNYVCDNCYVILKNFMEFRAVSRQTEAYLRSLLGSGQVNEEDQKAIVANLLNNQKLEGVIKQEMIPDLTNNECDYENYEMPIEIEMQESDGELKVVTQDSDDKCFEEKTQGEAKIINRFDGIFKCNQCCKKFHKRYMLEAHIKSAHEGVERPFVCPHCPSTFRIVMLLTRHMRSKHPSDDTKKFLFDCMICHRQFTRKDRLKEHIRNVHEKKQSFKCSVCEKTFSSKRTQMQHELIHSAVRPYKCELCDKSYIGKRELIRHLQRHNSPPDMLCPICKRTKKSPEELQIHIAKHKASRKQCPKCGKTFAKQVHLQEHDITVHLKLRPFKCCHCGVAFAARKSLKLHERKHDPTGRTDHCGICQLYFETKRALLLHMNKTHSTQEKPKEKQNN